MSKIFQFLTDDVIVLLTMAAGVGMTMRFDKRKKSFVCRVILCLMAMAVFCLLINDIRAIAGRTYILWLAIAKYTILLILSMFAVMVCYPVGWGTATINVASAFCIEHISQRTKSLFLLCLPREKVYEVAVIYGLTALILWLYYRLFEKHVNRPRSSSYRIDGVQAFVGIAVVCTDIVFSFVYIDISVKTNARAMMPMGYIASILFSVLALVISRCHLAMTQAAYDRSVIAKMWHDERQKFEHDQTQIDALNIKAHDLKHRLRALDAHLSDAEKQELYQAVEAYDAIVRTGHSALDVVMTNKSLECLSRGITLTCMVDGSCLAFMKDHDVYSLFGNIIDNAIDAMDQVTVPDQRIISLTVARRNGMVSIHQENYYTGSLAFFEGLPMTTHSDTINHGFGMKSIRLLTEKYGGHIQLHTDEQIFALDILIPAECR